jgi:hypothetical protein
MDREQPAPIAAVPDRATEEPRRTAVMPEPYNRQGSSQRGYDNGHGRNGFGEPESLEHHGATAKPGRNGANHKENAGSFIDKELRARVDGDIAAFLTAFDAALQHDSQQSRTELREATDRLLRAGARTRIELERMEARIPLPPREGARSEAMWRHR